MGGRVFGCEWFVWKDVRGMMGDGYGDRVVVEKFCEWVEVYVEYFEEYMLGDGGEGKDLLGKIVSSVGEVKKEGILWCEVKNVWMGGDC